MAALQPFIYLQSPRTASIAHGFNLLAYHAFSFLQQTVISIQFDTNTMKISSATNYHSNLEQIIQYAILSFPYNTSTVSEAHMHDIFKVRTINQ